jgi:5'-nucleotidase
VHILISNDDGIGAPGIKALARALADVADVTVVAPDRERSATGHAITVHHPLRVRRYPDYPVPEAYAVDGTPADCVKIALEALSINRPDMVIAGINRGPNLGTDVLYSGTVSAAIEAAILGLPAMAVSLVDFREDGYEEAALFVAKMAGIYSSRGLPPDTLLNINWPQSKPRGVKVTTLGRRRYTNTFEKRHDPSGREYFWMGGDVVLDETADTDTWAVSKGYASITPIHFDLTNYNLVAQVRSWNIEF